MTTTTKPRAEGAGERKNLPPAMLAALWTVSNGQCYAPNCPMPVVLEVRPGVYQKNSQVAHIYGVKPKSARFQGEMSAEERDSFANLLLLCLAHHEEVDGDESRYTPEVLKSWKARHEGEAGAVLARLRVPDTETLGRVLTELAEPPLERLEAVTKRLEETGVANSETVAELRGIIATIAAVGGGVSGQTARSLAYAAEVFGEGSFDRSARAAAYAAEVFEGDSFGRSVRAAAQVADTLPHLVKQLERAVRRMSQFQ
ncbi:hypothetical protein [Micromonospora humida]|uniref:hypothetical protein n=1 Tax=Micromonospora humida TaxID=2809018 RepID=UPI0027DB8473|nr:hypothetical protein [Micromonospora humida]